MGKKISELIETEVEAVQQANLPAVSIVEPQQLIALAIERGTPAEALERLLAMRDKLKAEAAQEAFAGALAAFQGECPLIGKDKQAGDGRFAYKYTPMEHIRPVIAPLLLKHGFSYCFDYAFEPGAITTVFKLIHAGGHIQTTTVKVPLEGRMNDTQKIGSAQTYSERYAMKGGLGLVFCNEDDDAQSAIPPINQAPRDAAPTPRPASFQPQHANPPRPPEPIFSNADNWMRGIVDVVTEKTTKNGQAFLSVLINKKWMNVFDKKHIDLLKQAKDAEAWYTTKTDGAFTNLVKIRFNAPESQQFKPAPTPDEGEWPDALAADLPPVECYEDAEPL